MKKDAEKKAKSTKCPVRSCGWHEERTHPQDEQGYILNKTRAKLKSKKIRLPIETSMKKMTSY